ncbi:MAG: class I SAM-dependent methyltransferase [Oscillospiraceae bacterium]|jgi:SAM-dependent methyltransferase|nr:class I SAM-dependent methyltransferase [Oscillospiraceae bacterium]
MLNKLKKYLVKPEIYTPGTNSMWDDYHISENMLDAHLEPENEAASRNHKFIDKSVKWITNIAPPAKYANLLDLGCGPGLYTKRFHKAGYTVTGIDFSKRSIEYAEVEAVLCNVDITYIYRSYLNIDYKEQFDIITLIYCDYAALSKSDRKILLEKIYQALKPGGMFIFDVFTHKMKLPASQTWYYSPDSGFFCDNPHLCLNSVYQYPDEHVELRQTIVVTEDDVKTYNTWECFYNIEQLVDEVLPIGFSSYKIYSDVAGKAYSDDSETLCGVFVK